MQLGRREESDVSRGRMILCTLFYVFTIEKCDLFEVDKAIYQVVERHFESIFCLLSSPKCDVVEVEKAMFKVEPFI